MSVLRIWIALMLGASTLMTGPGLAQIDGSRSAVPSEACQMAVRGSQN
jgi:hypothetical protein